MTTSCIKLPADDEPEFYQFIPDPQVCLVSQDDEDVSQLVDPSGESRIIYCNSLSVNDAIENLKHLGINSYEPNLIEKRHSSVEKLLALKKQLEQLQVDEFSQDIYNETTKLLNQKMTNFYQIWKSKTGSNEKTQNTQLEEELKTRLQKIENHLGIHNTQLNLPLHETATLLERKIALLDVNTIDTIYRKLKLLSIESAKEKQPISGSFEYKVNDLYEKYSGLQHAYSQIIPISHQLKDIKKMKDEATDVYLTIKELEQQKLVLLQMIHQLSERLAELEKEFKAAKEILLSSSK